MITQTVMSPAADAAAERYGLLTQAWASVFDDTLMAPDFGHQPAFDRAVMQAFEIARTFLETERIIISDRLDAIASEAHTDALAQISVTDARERPDAAGELLVATKHYLEREITIQIERDVTSLQRALRQVALQVMLTARSQRITPRAALMQYRVGSTGELQFSFLDRRSQKWPSRRFVRTVWRQALLSVFNEVTLLTLADHGLDYALVSHVSGKAEVDGMRVALATNSSFPSYGEIRDEIFHPNADAILVAPGAEL